MSSSKEFYEYVVYDVMGQIAGITSRRMFGGYGLYKNGVFFAIISDDQLYFKVGDNNKPDFEEHGSEPFTYNRKDRKEIQLTYWRVPEEVMEDRDELRIWIDKAVQASLKKSKK